jgi:DNA polymerase V
MSNCGRKRENAGRSRGQGKFGEPTTTMRIPESQTATVKSFLEAFQRKRANGDRDTSVVNIEENELLVPEISAQPTLLPLFPPKWRRDFRVRRMIMSKNVWMSVSF